MGKVFTTKQLRLRAKAVRRRQALRVTSPVVVRPQTLEESNRAVIAKLEAAMKAEN